MPYGHDVCVCVFFVFFLLRTPAFSSSYFFLCFFVYCLQRFPLLFAAVSSLVCSHYQSFLSPAVPSFVCSVRFLFAAIGFRLQRIFFACSDRFLFAAHLFCLQRSFFVFSKSSLFAACHLWAVVHTPRCE